MEKQEKRCFLCYKKIAKKVMAPEVVQSIAEGKETIDSAIEKCTPPKEVYCQGSLCAYLHIITMDLKRRVDILKQKMLLGR